MSYLKFIEPRERVVCADGFSMSVQAGASLYSTPRDDEGPYKEVEVGYPTRIDPILEPYAEDTGDGKFLTEVVYPYTPSSVVKACVESHGGIVSGELPPMEEE